MLTRTTAVAEGLGDECREESRYAEVIANLEVLLDDFLDGDRRDDSDAARLCVFREQRRHIALDRLVGKVVDGFAHLSLILICIRGNYCRQVKPSLVLRRCA